VDGHAARLPRAMRIVCTLAHIGEALDRGRPSRRAFLRRGVCSASPYSERHA
jgi:hypothetical protein